MQMKKEGQHVDKEPESRQAGREKTENRNLL